MLNIVLMILRAKVAVKFPFKSVFTITVTS